MIVDPCKKIVKLLNLQTDGLHRLHTSKIVEALESAGT